MKNKIRWPLFCVYAGASRGARPRRCVDGLPGGCALFQPGGCVGNAITEAIHEGTERLTLALHGFAISEGRTVITGSYNWTLILENNWEHLLILDCPELAKSLRSGVGENSLNG